ncbi:hypothetical protein FB565_007200 [Actinoplanes lutulentus]|uniref:Uncharacterized protein DUF4129 n=1 Tax=Actinoplanes lutulentus TaxID=1287878 RepID=A0A327ZCL9_9ACTN|nr:DUF4129 domain-containing protein [Actinoplanes lutulentus]MBB2947432.1 hypothetical protein [Actinoplanes lutulentus]RAK36705.1 uncharacterized protein DUF4129 [Actinoplanes lutulentus]
MTRGYDAWIADVLDVIPGRTLLLGLFLITLVGSVLWYSFPAWVPRRWPSFRLPALPRLPRRRRKKSTSNSDQKPPSVRVKAPSFQPDANVLASEGRYDEAIRQRLRDTVIDLTRAGVVSPEPGTTVAELADVTALNQPVAAPAMDAAAALFSEVWYGRREAGPSHDEHMRRLTDEVRSSLGGPR